MFHGDIFGHYGSAPSAAAQSEGRQQARVVQIADAALGAGMPAFNSLKVVSYDTAKYAADTTRLVEKWVNQVLTAK